MYKIKHKEDRRSWDIADDESLLHITEKLRAEEGHSFKLKTVEDCKHYIATRCYDIEFTETTEIDPDSMNHPHFRRFTIGKTIKEFTLTPTDDPAVWDVLIFVTDSFLPVGTVGIQPKWFKGETPDNTCVTELVYLGDYKWRSIRPRTRVEEFSNLDKEVQEHILEQFLWFRANNYLAHIE